MMLWVDSVPLIIVTVVCVLIAIAQINGLRHFRSLRHLLVVQKRYPMMVQMECIACILLLMIGIPMMAYTNGLSEIYTMHTHSTQLALIISFRILNNILGHFIADIEACRLWLMSFDLHYLHSSQNEKWKIQIDPSFAERDWYLCNKSRWGNEHYVFKRVSIYYLSATTIGAGAYCYIELFHPEYFFVTALIDMVLVILPLVIINYTYCKTPTHLNDNLFFHVEYRATATAISVGFVTYLVSVIPLENGYPRVGVSMAVFALLIMLSVPSLLSTIWIPSKIQRSLIWVCSVGDKRTEPIVL